MIVEMNLYTANSVELYCVYRNLAHFMFKYVVFVLANYSHPRK